MIHRVVKRWSCSLGGALPSPSFSAERALTMAFIWAKMSQTLIRGEHFSWYQSWIFFSSEANRNPKQTSLERTKNLFTISFQVFSGWDQGWILPYLVQPAKISSQSHIWGLAYGMQGINFGLRIVKLLIWPCMIHLIYIFTQSGIWKFESAFAGS